MAESSQSRSASPLGTTKKRAKERAQETAQQKTDEVVAEIGRLAFDKLEEYFPEEAEARRQENRYQLIMVGVALGFLLRHIMGRKTGIGG